MFQRDKPLKVVGVTPDSAIGDLRSRRVSTKDSRSYKRGSIGRTGDGLLELRDGHDFLCDPRLLNSSIEIRDNYTLTLVEQSPRPPIFRDKTSS